MTSLRRSLSITFLASNGATVVNFLVAIILARMLSPAEIGVFSIAYVLVSVAHIFRDFGVTTYLVHEKDLTPEKIRSISGVLFASSWATAAVLYSLSGVAADYYRQPGVESVVKVLALGFVFIPFGAITHSLLTRELKAREQAIASVLGVTVYATSSVAFAWFGFSYMTMAWANLLNIIATAIAYLPFRPENAPWLPSFRGWGRVMNFGTGVLFSNAVKELNNSLPDFALGKLSGPHAVGIVSRANSTSNLFSKITEPTISYAVLPVLSRKHHAGESIAEPMAKAIANLTGLAWPALVGTAIFAEPIILFLFGPQWLESVPLVRIISAIAFIAVPFTFTTLALQATGRPYLAAVPGAFQLVFSALAILVIFDQNLTSFAYALLIANVVSLPAYLWLQQYHLGFSARLFRASLQKSIPLTLAMAVLITMLAWFLNGMQAWIQVPIVMLVASVGWGLLVVRLEHPIKEELAHFAGKLGKSGKAG
jgi:O-antigen/teichoic acid export membrane protein